MTMFVNGNPINGFAVVVGPIGIALMVLHVDGVVIGLREAAGDRLNDAKKAIQKLEAEERIVNEVMSDAVDVGIDHESVNESQNEHDPERSAREKEEESKEVGEME
jgi:tRNA(Ile2) C34 agmatinyltransferase TiaS